jgi:hypothetical protein
MQGSSDGKVACRMGTCPNEPQSPVTMTLELQGQSEKCSDQGSKNNVQRPCRRK